jgi:hypothetical protein
MSLARCNVQQGDSGTSEFFNSSSLNFSLSLLLAPRRPFRTLASDTIPATRFESGNVSAVGLCCEAYWCCEHVATNIQLSAPSLLPNIVYMLRAMLRVCGEHVPSLWRACCDQHPNISVLGSCCELCYLQHPTSGAFLPLPSDTIPQRLM